MYSRLAYVVSEQLIASINVVHALFNHGDDNQKETSKRTLDEILEIIKNKCSKEDIESLCSFLNERDN